MRGRNSHSWGQGRVVLAEHSILPMILVQLQPLEINIGPSYRRTTDLDKNLQQQLWPRCHPGRSTGPRASTEPSVATGAIDTTWDPSLCRTTDPDMYLGCNPYPEFSMAPADSTSWQRWLIRSQSSTLSSVTRGFPDINSDPCFKSSFMRAAGGWKGRATTLISGKPDPPREWEDPVYPKCLTCFSPVLG